MIWYVLQLTLKLDASYKLHIKASDKAGNTVCANHSTEINKSVRDEFKCEYKSPASTLVPGYQSAPTREYNGYDMFRIKTYTHLAGSNDGIFESTSDLTSLTNKVMNSSLNFETFKFSVEKNSVINITNKNLGRTLYLDPRFPAFPVETDIASGPYDSRISTKTYTGTSKLYGDPIVVCNKFLDHDGVAETPMIETCDVLVRINLVVNSIKGSPQDNQINIVAYNGIASNALKVNTRVDRFNILVNSTTATPTFSPDNDGKFDNITFDNVVTANGVKLTEAQILASTPVITITNSAGTLNFTKAITGSSSFVFDSKVNNVVIADGAYKYYTTITYNGVNYTSNIVDFNVVTNVTPTEKPSIFTPVANYTTTRGVLTIQGMGPKSIANNSEAQYDIEVCARLSNKTLVTQAIQSQLPTNGCAYTSKVRTTTTGFYTILATLPFDNQEYDLEVKSVKGQQSSPISTTKINYTTPESIKDITVTSSLEGLNSKDQLACVYDPAMAKNIDCSKVNINNLKTLKIDVTVTKGTEAVELDFSDNTNLNALPNDDKAQYYGQFNGRRIGIINDLTQVNPKLNPNMDERIKVSQEGWNIAEIQSTVKSGKDLAYGSLRKPCEQATCTWSYIYPLPYHMAGGKYEVQARTFKGESTQTTTQGFEVNGIVKQAPQIVRIEKQDITAECAYKTKFEANINCTNTESRVTRSLTVSNNQVNSVVNTPFNYTPTNSIQSNTTIYYTNSNRITVWAASDVNTKYTYKLSSQANSTTATVNPNGLSEIVLDLDNIASGTTKAYTLTLTTRSADNTSDIVSGSTNYVIVQDKQLPTLESTTTFNKSTSGVTKSVNPWIRNGDQVNFNLFTNEAIDYGYVISESGYREFLTRDLVSNNLTHKSNSATSLTSDQKNICNAIAQLDIKSAIYTNSKAIPTYCINSYYFATNLSADLTIQREKLEGRYLPTIFLSDLAGNTNIVNNDTDKNNALANNIINDNKVNLKKLVNGVFVYDYDALAYSTINGAPFNNAGVTNGSWGFGNKPTPDIYSGTARTNSLDFSLIIDNTRPIRSEFNLKGVGDAIIEYDTITNTPRVNSNTTSVGPVAASGNVNQGFNQGSLNTTRTGAIKTDGVLSNGGLEINKLKGQLTTDPLNPSTSDIVTNKYNTNQGYDLVTNNNKVELRLKAEKNTNIQLALIESKTTPTPTLGLENKYAQTQLTTITPASKSIDYSSCTTDLTQLQSLARVDKRSADSAYNATSNLVRQGFTKQGQYNPALYNIDGTIPTGVTQAQYNNNILALYDNNVTTKSANDNTLTSPKYGLGNIIVSDSQYCDVVFTYDFKDRKDLNGNTITTSNQSPIQTGRGETPNGNPLEYFSIQFYTTDNAGNVNTTEQEYADSINAKAITACAYNATTGNLNPRLSTSSSKLSPINNDLDIILFRGPSSNWSCSLSIGYDNEAPLTINEKYRIDNLKSTNTVNTDGRKVLSTQGIGTTTALSKITSSSYQSNINNTPTESTIPDYLTGKGSTVQNMTDTTTTSANAILFSKDESNQFAITRDTNINVTTTAEARSDIVYTLNDSNNNKLNINNSNLSGKNNNDGKLFRDNPITTINPSLTNILTDPTTRRILNADSNNRDLSIATNTNTTNFNLGAATSSTNGTINTSRSNTRDEDINKKTPSNIPCTTTTNNSITTKLGIIPATVNRKVGTCDDGLYKISTYATDTAGNYIKNADGTPQMTDRVVERDTVAPNKPNIEAGLVLDSIDQGQVSAVKPMFLSANINGEGLTTLEYNILGSNEFNKTSYAFINSQGNFNSNNIVGSLPCGEVKFDIKARIFDRARNVSEWSETKTIITKQCPVCPQYDVIDKTANGGAVSQSLGENGQGFTHPLGNSMQPSYGYGYSGSYGGTHYGIDFSVPSGSKIFAAKAGKVIYARTDNTGSNTTIIAHSGNLFSLYAHQSAINKIMACMVDIIVNKKWSSVFFV